MQDNNTKYSNLIDINLETDINLTKVEDTPKKQAALKEEKVKIEY